MKYIIPVDNDAIEITTKDLRIVRIRFTNEQPPSDGYMFPSGGARELYLRAEKQFNEYFNGSRQEFELPAAQDCSAFQKIVLSEIQNIAYGETISYSELAKRCGKDKSIRAVAGAVAKNKLLLVFPCHRVIKKSGNLGGYSGGKERKLRLLTLEKAS